MVNELAGVNGTTPSLTEVTSEARHIVTTGNNDYLVKLPAAQQVIGSAQASWLGHSLHEESVVPLTRIHSSTNQLGFGFLVL